MTEIKTGSAPVSHGTGFQLFATLIANLMAVTDGIGMGWTAPFIPYFLSEKSHIKMTRTQADWLETSLLIGAVVGLPITIYFVDKIGRKKSLMLSTSLLVLCWIVIAIADRVEYLLASRFCQGLGLNMAFVAAPMYVGEISHKKIRGFLSSTIFVLMLLGVLVIYSVGPYLPFFVPSVIAGSLLFIEFVAFNFLPESPYYLLTKKRYEEARSSLLRFRDNHDEVESELKEMSEEIEIEQKEEKSSIKDLFLVKSYRKAITIMFVLNTAQLFAGFEVILMNLHEILGAAGSIYIDPPLAAIIFAALMLAASTVTAVTVDKFGRKGLMIISSSLTGICLMFLAVYFNLKQLDYEVSNISWIPIAAIMTYAAAFKFGLGIVPIVITAEIFASKVKAIGMTISDGIYVIASILALQVYFLLKDRFGMHVPFYIFCCCCFSTAVFIAFFVPETKGKSLEEIQRILRGSAMSSETISCKDENLPKKLNREAEMRTEI